MITKQELQYAAQKVLSNNSDLPLYLFAHLITDRQRSSGKVMFSQACVCPHRGEWVSLVPGHFWRWVSLVPGLFQVGRY